MSGHTPWSEIKRKARVAHATYTLTVYSTLKAESAALNEELLRETEENLTDLLPMGWWVEIREWDNDDGHLRD